MAYFKTKFSTGRQDWETPNELFDPLNAEFGFTLDVCATVENAKCPRFYARERFIRRIQADALRAAADHIASGVACKSKDEIRDLANQLHPLRDGKE